MEIWNGRPEITSADHPATVYRALMASYALWATEQGQEASHIWSKKEQDASGALGDGFGIFDPNSEPLNPDGHARLYMSTDELEYTLVGYGCDLIDEDEVKNAAEIDRVDDLLRSIDIKLERKKSTGHARTPSSL